MDANRISCPNCGQEIDVNDILYHELQSKIKADYDKKSLGQKAEYDSKFRELKEKETAIKNAENNLNEKIENSVNSRLTEERKKTEDKLRKKISEEKEEEIRSYREQLDEKTKETKEMFKLKAEHEKLKRDKEELREKIEAEAEERINKIITEEKNRLLNDFDKSTQLKIAQKEHLISQLTEQLKDAQRKAEQGSVQAQGEIQELAIEEWLRDNFRSDDILEIKKGVKGGDCIQVVNTMADKNCGTIYYESKRTKDFKKEWIEKFKADMREKGANAGVIITEAYPKDFKRMGLYEGVWICTLEEFKGLCFVLRESIIGIHNATKSQENKGEKMNMLYSYLTSNEFKLQIEAIVGGFVQMGSDLESEKRAMEGIWKKREKQIQKVLMNTNHMYYSFKGIAGSAIAPIKQLELPEPEAE